MMTPEESDLLCRVEGEAPMGGIMRRHWIAACLSEEVAAPDGAPIEVRLLGEHHRRPLACRDTRDALARAHPRCARELLDARPVRRPQHELVRALALDAGGATAALAELELHGLLTETSGIFRAALR